jgi:hypothetical protein
MPQQADFSEPIGGPGTTLGRKAWTAYIGVTFLAIVILFAASLAWHYMFVWFGVSILVVGLAVVIVKIMELRAYRLYTNEMGVWLSTGILPWTKGVRGVKWRDVDDATYTRSLGSWLLKSYAIRIGHRFTRTNELLLDGVAHGDKVVTAINAQLQEMARAGKLN